VTAALRRSLSSLSIPNYRRWFIGQLISVSGNWMQIVAEMWLILTLTGSAIAVGITAALQFLPMLLFGAWGGLLVDRFPKRRILMLTQSLLVIPALALFAVTAADAVTAGMVFALVLVRGLVLAIDWPARQSFVIELVGPERVVNAVSLQSVLVHSSRVFGPALAGLLIATVGLAFCFLLNALSFVAMIAMLRSLDGRAIQPAQLARPERGGVRAGLRHVLSRPELAIPMAMMALVGTLGLNFQVLLPLLADITFHGDSSTYSALAVTMGVGSVLGALATGARGQVNPRVLVLSSLGFAVFATLAALAPTLPLAALALAGLGAAAVTFSASVNSTLQLRADPSMRGRVMALYSIVFLGSTPIGSPIVGWLAEHLGPRAGLVMGALAALVAAAGAYWAFARAKREAGTAEFARAFASPPQGAEQRERCAEPRRARARAERRGDTATHRALETGEHRAITDTETHRTTTRGARRRRERTGARG